MINAYCEAVNSLTHTDADNVSIAELRDACRTHNTFGTYGVDRCECSGCARIRLTQNHTMNTQNTVETKDRLHTLGQRNLVEETLSDGSKVYNVEIPAQTIYCRNQVRAINLLADLDEAIVKAQ